MSVLQALVSFALVSALLVIMPGVDTALVIRNTVARGRLHGFITGVGVGVGAVMWGAAIAVGVGALLAASETAYTVFRIVGAAYMVWLGIGLWRSARAIGAAKEGEADLEPEAASLWRSFGRGMLNNLANPKVGVFYGATIPQFIPEGVSPALMGTALAAVNALEAVIWYGLISLGAHGLRTWMRRRSVRRNVDATAGTVMIAFGIAMAVQS
ncbi:MULTISPECIES: LysE family translocator [Streptomyces]|uniref:LysE family translocator n=1 Tax=Streptomyces caniscabiei TaxID=2746961 RepID=A0ABU4MTD8_9ACTN|nr:MULTISPECIES: LysE family translocator [Streptomyces]MBE4740080.1 LysE family translocator [Streptomyces caniscabiei]MBE4758970.1 LysE family translocator [Streptomyces caniscabiei]MBE4772839.1 LysE family translocator [Streptomyces caniscabiei]MBE4788272.1 LysE family translocator [Streptomyces caniscabiei]MBE4797511.1 LysE family translocator [Streptomyces caniscabiei]